VGIQWDNGDKVVIAFEICLPYTRNSVRQPKKNIQKSFLSIGGTKTRSLNFKTTKYAMLVLGLRGNKQILAMHQRFSRL
jgi:hypothetical protein